MCKSLFNYKTVLTGNIVNQMKIISNIFYTINKGGFSYIFFSSEFEGQGKIRFDGISLRFIFYSSLFFLIFSTFSQSDLSQLIVEKINIFRKNRLISFML